METPAFTTPQSTTGIGNPAIPGENGETGSGDVFAVNEKPKKKKFTSLKKYLKNRKNK